MNTAPLSLDPVLRPAGSLSRPGDPVHPVPPGDRLEGSHHQHDSATDQRPGAHAHLHPADVAAVAPVVMPGGFSLLRASLGLRLVLALGLSALIWAGIVWAMTPIVAS